MENIPTREGEVWKPIRGFPSYYFSNLNRVYKVPNQIQTKIREGRTKYGLLRGTDNIPTYTSWLYREHFPYEWIKYLGEGEEVKPLYNTKNII